MVAFNAHFFICTNLAYFSIVFFEQDRLTFSSLISLLHLVNQIFTCMESFTLKQDIEIFLGNVNINLLKTMKLLIMLLPCISLKFDINNMIISDPNPVANKLNTFFNRVRKIAAKNVVERLSKQFETNSSKIYRNQ